MTIEVLAMKVISVVVPYLLKGADEFAKEAGKAAFGQVTRIVSTLERIVWKDSQAKERFWKFKSAPIENESAMKSALAVQLKHDSSVEGELRQLLEALGPSIKVIQKFKSGTDVVGLKARQMSRGSAQVEQHIDDAKNVTGAEIDEI